MAVDVPIYLKPYLTAAEKYGAGFGTLLWASPKTQAIRFTALLRAVDFTGKTVLDVGAGRADLLQFMIAKRIRPKRYIALEAVDVLADAAEEKKLPDARIIRGDFVSDPSLLEQRADIIAISGSLNTLDEAAFYRTLKAAWAATRTTLVFNFLSSPYLAASPWLTWHRPEAVLAFAGSLCDRPKLWEDYLSGDATLMMRKEPAKP